MIVVGVLAFIPFLGIAFFFAALSALGGGNGDSGARDIVLFGAAFIVACIACIRGVTMQRRGNAVPTPSPELVVGADVPPPPPPAAAPAAPRTTAARLLGVAAGTLATAFLLPFGLMGLSIVAEIAGVPLVPIAVAGAVTGAVVGVRRLMARRRQTNSD